MKNNKKTLLVLLLLTPLLTGCVNRITPTSASQGRLDLTEVDLNQQLVSLSGEWEFYWNQLLYPFMIDQGELSAIVDVPSTWNRYAIDGEKLPGQGYATYRLTFTSDKTDILGIKIPKVQTAYEMYINGKLIASAGLIGRDEEDMVAQYLPQIAFFNAREGENEIILLVSNYYMPNGGMLSEIEMGSAAGIQALRESKLNTSLAIFGALVIMGFYHLALFFFRKKDYSSLYFGLFCMLVAARTLMAGEGYYYTLFQNGDFTYFRKIQTMLFYLSPPMIILFFGAILPDYFHAKMVDLSLYVGLIYALIVMFIPLGFFHAFNTSYQIWCLFLIGYMLTRFVNIWRHRVKGTFLISLGGLILILTIFIDIISQSFFINNQCPPLLQMIFRNDDYSSTGQLIFVIAYSFHMAKTFSDSLEFKTQMNAHLDEIVTQRTQALSESNQKVEQQKLELQKANEELQKLSLRDPLTGLWNRRKYDEVIDMEWKRCLRYSHPISLIFIDIDYFKFFNDTYGHLAGDDCLAQIASILKASLSRATDMAVRFGGEEFVILLPEANEIEALKTSQMLRQKIEESGIPHSESLVKDCVTVSIGVSSIIPTVKVGPEKLVEQADTALYRAKNNGRNQVQVFSGQ
ncbi:diguanylate cyclase [Eubacteriaceae bacterium ES3]|nr:diguanylate cyclase [Eubacteriaceae bacterium ES3]